jgi:hypothetical protein
MAEHDVARKEVTSARSTRSSCRASRGEPWASSLVTSCWWSLWRIRSSCSANPPAMSRRRGVSCEASTRRTIFAGNGEPGSEAATGMAACPTPSRSRFLKCSSSHPGVRTRDDERRWPRCSCRSRESPWIGVGLEMADRAASIRARYRLRTPDAIHLATAILEGVDVFLTNDRDLLQVREVPILLIDELR